MSVIDKNVGKGKQEKGENGFMREKNVSFI